MNRKTAIAVLAYLCASPVSAMQVELENVQITSYQLGVMEDQSHADKWETLRKDLDRPLPAPLGEKQKIRDMQQHFDGRRHAPGLTTTHGAPKIPDGTSNTFMAGERSLPNGHPTGAFFLRNANAPSSVPTPKLGAPALAPTLAVPSGVVGRPQR